MWAITCRGKLSSIEMMTDTHRQRLSPKVPFDSTFPLRFSGCTHDAAHDMMSKRRW